MPKLVRLPTAGNLNPRGREISKAVTPGTLSRVQDNVSKVVNQLQPSTQHVPSGNATLPGGTSPMAGATRHSVELTTTFQNIPHKLGRAWTGYQVISQDGSVNTVLAERGSPDDTKYIQLKTSGSTANCTVLVF